MVIKIGCNSLALRDLTAEEFIRTAAELRMDVVDFYCGVLTSHDHGYLASIKQLCLEHGMPIGYIGVSGLFHGTAAENAQHAAQSIEEVDVAAFLGAPLVRMFCATVPEHNADGDPVWPAMIAGYRQVADHAAALGVAVGLQNHPSTADEMLRIRADVQRPNFGFLMDTGQWVGSPGASPKGESDPSVDFYAYMQQTVPFATYIRCKFYKVEGGAEEWLDYERIAEIILRSGFNGCISIVYEGEQEDHAEQVRLAAAQLRRLLR